MEKYHVSSLIQDFVFLSWKKGCIWCISLQVYNNITYPICLNLFYKYTQQSSGARCLVFWNESSSSTLMLCVCVSSEYSGETAVSVM